MTFADLLCFILGHTKPYQYAGETIFRCRRCQMAFAGIQATHR